VKIDKRTVLTALRARLAEDIAMMSRLALEAAEAASHEENKPENDKDMRSTEASYVARGQAERARDLERAHALLGSMAVRGFESDDAIAIGALVELRHREAVSVCLLVSAGGGTRARVEGVEVQAVTPTSPLGAALLGLSEGAEVEVRTPQGTKVYEVVSVQ
jgi:transcription elongation GreA/GreB family factor